jgi:hypothetical protein
MTLDLELPIHPVTGLSALAVFGDRPVWPVLGAASDDDDDDLGIDLAGGGKPAARQAVDQDDEDDEDLDDEHDDEDAAGDKDKDTWKPPTKDEWQKVQDALSNSNAEAKRYRLRLREQRREQREAQQQAAKSGTSDDEAAARAAQDAADAAERKYKPVAVRSAARAALLAAGLNDGSDSVMRKLLKLVDMDDVDLDEDGDVVGLDDQIDDIKDTFPRLFEKTEPEQQQRSGRPRAPRINGADKKTAPPEPKTTGEKHMARLNSVR